VSIPGIHRGKKAPTYSSSSLNENALGVASLNSDPYPNLKRMDEVGHTHLRAVLHDFCLPPPSEVVDDAVYYQVSFIQESHPPHKLAKISVCRFLL